MSDKTRDKLLPCPFCGGEADVDERYDQWDGKYYEVTEVRCVVCDAMVAVSEYKNKDRKERKAEAIAAWNTRKPMERIVERLEALRAEHEEREKDARKVGLTEHADLNGIKAYIYDDAIDIVKEGE